MKVLKSTVQLKLAAIFILFAAALLLTANVSNRLNLSGIEPGVTAAQADDPPPPDNTIVNEAPVSGDMAS